jgi:hypothetical protein
MAVTTKVEVKRSVQRDLFKHAGRWVAITRDKLVAVGDSPKQVSKKARSEGVDRPIVYKVPRPDEASVNYF